ncbi:MAG: 16S rRNA (guanine(966)-N(2))-methyltransferase RsmD, partial [Solirubrobacteraceae bacterium]
MRVVAGRYGGRRLTAPRGRATRPTSDRVREALFSMLGDVHQMRVLDLFAGTGALAIEALSRGAQSAVLVERDERALAALHANLEALGLGGEQVRVLAMDAATALQTARARRETYDLIFIDPPYQQAPEYSTRLQTALTGLLAPAARVVVES